MDIEAHIQEVGTREGYDRWSEFYDARPNPLIALEERYFPPLLGAVRGMRVADIGCGTGRHAVALGREGAAVVGLDFSTGMLRQALAKRGDSRAHFAAADLDRPLPLREGAFDRVICCLVTDHIANLAALFCELGRICRKGGFIVIAAMHPAIMLRGVQAQFRDPATGIKVRPRSVANQIADYVNAAVAAGLRIEHMSEHPVDEAVVAQVADADKYLGWPMLLMMKLAV